MKKLLFPIASFGVGLICEVAITGHPSSAPVLDQLDDPPRATVGDGVLQHAPVRTSTNALSIFKFRVGSSGRGYESDARTDSKGLVASSTTLKSNADNP